MLRLTFTDDRGCFVFRRYSHEHRGVVETLTCGNVIHIRPGFGGDAILHPYQQAQEATSHPWEDRRMSTGTTRGCGPFPPRHARTLERQDASGHA
jgi:hypothetical protein